MKFMKRNNNQIGCKGSNFFCQIPFVFLISWVLLLGCSPFLDGPPREEGDRKDQQTRMKLVSLYSQIQGTYTGMLTRAEGEKKIEGVKLFIWYVEVVTGKTPAGDDKFLPILKARLHLKEYFENDLYLTAKYVEESGQLSLTGEDLYIQGQLVKDLFKGQVTLQGNLGTLVLTRTESSAQNPSGLIEEEKRQRMSALVGEYDVLAVPEGGDGHSYRANLSIQMLTQPSALLGFFEMPPLQVFKVQVNYDYEKTPQEVVIKTKDGESKGSLDFLGIYDPIKHEITGQGHLPRYTVRMVAKRNSSQKN